MSISVCKKKEVCNCKNNRINMDKHFKLETEDWPLSCLNIYSCLCVYVCIVVVKVTTSINHQITPMAAEFAINHSIKVMQSVSADTTDVA